MSLEFEATDGRRIAKTLFASNIDIQTVRFNLGTTIVELNSKDHADGSKTLDVLLRQNLDSNYIADYSHPIGGASGSQEMAILPHDSSYPETGRTREEVSPMTKVEFEKKMRGWMMILATLFASMTFQAGLNPPGGFWQDDKGHTAGSIILRENYFPRFIVFYVSNTLAFAYSMLALFAMLSETYLSKEGILSLRTIMIPDMLLVMVAFLAGSSRDPFLTLSSLAGMVAALIVLRIGINKYKAQEKSAMNPNE